MQVLLYIAFIVVTIIQLYYWLYSFAPVAFRKREKDFPLAGDRLAPVSVVICAKNEARRLRHNLPGILSQDYPDYEVLVVSDHSTDDSAAVLATLRQKYPRLKYWDWQDPETDRPGKKAALAFGIRQARHDWVLLTDADCRPVSSKWIAAMWMAASGGKSIGLGYAPYSYRPGLLNALIRHETIITALLYLSAARRGRPYMGVGRNLLYRKQLFFRAGGFAGHRHIASGDDDLFIHQVATKDNTAIVDIPEALVYSEPKTTIKSWLRQKRRHISTGSKYDTYTQFRLFLFAFSHFSHLFLGVLLLILGFGTVVAWCGLTVRILAVGVICARQRKKFREAQEAWYRVVLAELFYPLYYLLLAPSLFSTKTQPWK